MRICYGVSADSAANISIVADLAFNDIPLNHENVETREKGHSSNPESKQRKKRNPCPDETKSFTDALKRLRADYPPPESASRPTSTVVSSVVCTRRSNGDNNERPLPRGSHTPRSHTPQSLSIRSHPMAVHTSRSFVQEAQGRPSTEKESIPVIGREDLTPRGQDAVGSHKYEDKGVMVSPWLHQRTRENMPYGTTTADHQFRPRRPESSPNAVFEILAPEVSDEVTEAFNFKGPRIEDTTIPRDKIPPMSYFDKTSDHYPSHASRPWVGSDFSSPNHSFDHSNASKFIDMQHRDAYSIDWPAKPVAFQPHQDVFQGANALSQRTSQIVDDIPGETLKEYIARMEREILGAEKPSARYIDKALLPAEADVLDNTIQPRKALREIGYRDRFLQRDQPHESVDLFSKHYPRLSYPDESPDESEPAFVWQPNHMMWR